MTRQQSILEHFIKYHSDLVWIKMLPYGGTGMEVTLEDGSWKLFQCDEQGIWEWSEDGKTLISEYGKRKD